MEITHQINNPDGTVQGGRILRPGEIINTWCRVCGHSTPHIYQPQAWPPLKCTQCTEAK
jgi:hypothetical protein